MIRFGFFKTITLLIIVSSLLGCTTNPFIIETRIAPMATGNFPRKYEKLLVLDSVVVSAPTTYNGYLFVQTNNMLYKFDSLGNLIWNIKNSGYPGMFSPTGCGNLIVAPVVELREFVVVSDEDGSLVWKSTSSDSANQGKIEDIVCFKNIVYVAEYNSGVLAYDITNGQIIWKQKVPERSSIYLSVNEEEQELYVVAGKGVTAYDLSTGTANWEILYNTYVGPAIKDQNKLVIVLGPLEPTEVTVVELSSRSTLWRRHIDGLLSNAFGRVIINSDTIYLSGNKIIALSMLTGDISWESEETEMLRRFVLLKNKIYVRNNGSLIYMIDVKTGNIEGALTVGKESNLNSFDRSPAIIKEQLIVPFGDNRIYIYKP